MTIDLSHASRATTPGQVARAVVENVEQVVKGKTDVVRRAVACLLAEGHLLVEDVPGLGKTSLARSLAASVGGSWRRIQFTPDLLPGDITGVMVFHQDSATFQFHPGGIFANVVVADEINRGTPKAQAALLEVMEEHVVTVDSHPHDVPRPFMVVATQNPIDLDGTYRLPEAQLDRFLMKVAVGYPEADAEVAIALADGHGPKPQDLRPVVDLTTLWQVITLVHSARVDPAIARYAVEVARATRADERARLGVSPRGAVALVRAARAVAAMADRSYVTPDDVKDVARPVLAHRVILTPDAELQRASGADVVERALAGVPVPRAAAPVD